MMMPKRYIHNALGCLVSILCLANSASANHPCLTDRLLKAAAQDCAPFVTDAQQADQPIVPYNPREVMDSFLQYYFAPWDNPFLFFSIDTLRQRQVKNLQRRLKKPGWALNRHPVSTALVQAIGQNMHLATFPNCKQAAIVVRPTHLRSIASSTTSFASLPSSSEGYPFDYWQESLLATNEPIYILHTSQDCAWNFVITNSYTYGWVQRADIAYTTPAFRDAWRASGQYVTPLQDKVPVADSIWAPLAHVGQLLPLASLQGDPHRHQVLSVYADAQGYAAIKASSVSKSQVALMPLLATPRNIAQLANSLMGQPYGWGGIEQYRDCSSLLKDICMPLGIWMPRDSGPQTRAGVSTDLRGLASTAKQALIAAQGTPFLAIVYMPSHPTLYLGTKEKRAYVYNQVWRFVVQDAAGTRREVLLGRACVIPLDLTGQEPSIGDSLLQKVTQLIDLADRLKQPHKPLALPKQ